MQNKLKVLWIAPIRHHNDNGGHPAPWIDELEKNINTLVNLTILCYTTDIKTRIERYKHDNTERIYIKGLRPKLDIVTLNVVKIHLLRKWLKSNYQEYDLIHIHGNEHQYEIACKNIPIPQLVSVQGILSEILKQINVISIKIIGWKIASIYENVSYQRVKYFSCRTDWDKKYVLNKNPNAKIFSIWEMIRPQFYIEDSINKGTNILFMGGSNPIKGLDIALNTFTHIASNFPGKLIIVGNVKQSSISKFLQKISSTEIKQRIQTIGFQNAEQIVKLARNSLCLLHPSRIDNSPNTICEAQILGLPVVASHVGGVPSLIDHKETGLLTSLAPQDIAKHILEIFNDKLLWQRISTNARETARKRHSKEIITQKTLIMYERIIRDYNN